MCNIAGYIGIKPAAPILIEMMRKQGRLEIIRSRVPGTAPGSTAPKLKARLK